MMKKKLIFGILITFLLIGLLTSQCKKEDDPLPYAIVNITIKPNSTQYINLNTTGGYEYLTANEPSRGVIVYRIDADNFVAFERTCPHDPDACCDGTSCARIAIEEGGLFMKDDCCESVYLILDGSNVSGSSEKPMKQYSTSYNGEILHIYN